MYRGLIAVDLDGTLLQNDFSLTAKDKAAVKKAHEAGYMIAICTGRSAHLVKRKVIDWDIAECVNVAIGCNGAEYCDCFGDNEVEIIGYITNAGVREVFEIMADVKEDYGFTWYSATDIYTSGKHERVTNMAKQMNLPITYFDRDKVTEVFPDKWPKAVFFFKNPNLRYIKDMIDSNKKEAYDMVFSLDIIMEMIPQGINKGTALKEIAKRFDLAKADIMAIGDEENDREMLENSGFAVAMGNATESIKEIADYITADCENSGVAQAIEVFIKKNRESNIQ